MTLSRGLYDPAFEHDACGVAFVATMTGQPTHEIVQQALAAKIPLIDQIIAAHKASASEIAIFSSETFGYPLLDLDAFNTDLIPKDAIDRKLVAAHRVVPALATNTGA